MDARAPEPVVVSVVLIVFNDKDRLGRAIQSALSQQGPVVDVIVVDDASTDGTAEVAAEWVLRDPRVRVVTRASNSGGCGSPRNDGLDAAKGEFVMFLDSDDELEPGAVARLVAAAERSGVDVVIGRTERHIQDADLEYDPAQYPRLLAPIVDGRADVVFGSRFMGAEPHRVLYFWHRVGNGVLTLLSNMFTNLNLTDMETCYKAFRREVIQSIAIEEDRFGFEPEITAKVAKLGCRVFEVGISYYGRTYAEGKKIHWRDGVRAIYCVVKYNLFR